MKDAVESIKCELVSFKSSDGISLHGALFKTGKKNKKAIVHVHGMTSNFFKKKLLWKLSGKAAEIGFDLFSINTRGSGVMTSLTKGKKYLLIGTALEKLTDCVFDIQGALAALQKLGYKEFVLSGSSTGCQKITYCQARKKSTRVKALLLLAPGDDYNLVKKILGKKFSKAVKLAKRMLSQGKGRESMPAWTTPIRFSAGRFLSYADPKSIEAQLFNYSGKLLLFSKIKEPVLAVFGSKDKSTDKTPKQMLETLEKHSNSKHLKTVLIEGADHGFKGKEKETTAKVIQFLKQL